MLISKFDNECTFEKISRIEKKYDIVLCQEYKNFLMKYNGGDTPKTNLCKGNVRTDIRRFYGFTEENHNSDLLYVLEGSFGEELISKFRLPIATNSFGDYFVIKVSEEENGKIFFIYHDKPLTEIAIASDFKEFVSLCKSEKIGYIRSIEERKKCLSDAGKADKITKLKIDNWQKEIDKYAGMKQEKVIL